MLPKVPTTKEPIALVKSDLFGKASAEKWLLAQPAQAMMTMIG